MLQQRQAGGFQDKASHRSPNSRSLHWRELYKQAEGLYDIGEYEQALVWYHRGRRLKPKAREFIKGIAKCEQAIEYKCPAALQDLNNHSAKTTTRRDVRRTHLTAKSAGTRVSFDDRPIDGDLENDIHHVTTLNKDKKYLQDFLKELGDAESTKHPKSGRSKKDVKMILQTSLNYLDTRTTFWKQHMPCHAIDGLETRPQTYVNPLDIPKDLGDDPFRSIFMTLLKEMMKANQEFIDRQYRLCIPRCENCIKMLRKLKSSEVDNKYEMLASLYSVMGNAQFELELYEEALKCYTKDLELAREKDIPEARSRALENMGRVYARVGEFDTAICVWKEKMGLCQSDRERAWLCHEVGYCYLNKKDYFSARQYAVMSSDSADLASDYRWRLNAALLIAQVEAKMKDYQSALRSFQLAAEIAETIGDTNEKTAIEDAIKSLNKAIVKNNKSVSDQKQVKGSEVFLTAYFEDDESDNKMAVSVPSNTLRTPGDSLDNTKMSRKDTLTPLEFQSQEIKDTYYLKQHVNTGIDRQVPILGTRMKSIKSNKTHNTPFNQTSIDLNHTQTGTLINEITTENANETVNNVTNIDQTNQNNQHNETSTKSKTFPKLNVHYNPIKQEDIADKEDSGSMYEELLPLTATSVKKLDTINKTTPHKRYSWKPKERLNNNNFPWKSKQHKPVSGVNSQMDTETEETFEPKGSITDRGTEFIRPHPPRTPHSSQSDSTLTFLAKRQSEQNKRFKRSLTSKPTPQSSTHPSIKSSPKQKQSFQSPYGQTLSRYHGTVQTEQYNVLPNVSVKRTQITTSSSTNNDTVFPSIPSDKNQLLTNSSAVEHSQETSIVLSEVPTKHFTSKGKRRYMSPIIPETEQKPTAKREGTMKSKPANSGGRARERNGDMSDMDLLKMLLDMK